MSLDDSLSSSHGNTYRPPLGEGEGEGSGYVLTQQFVEEVQNFLPGHPTLLPGNPCEVCYAIVDI